MSGDVYTVKNRRGPASEWASVAPVLAAGEFGIESDTGKIKVGDGVTAWSVLPYLTDHDHDEAYAAIAHDHEGIGDALTIKGVIVDDTDLADGRILLYDAAGEGSLKYADPPEGGGAVAPAPDVWRVPGTAITFPAALTFSALGVPGVTSWRFSGAVLHPNGLIYLFPGDLDPTACQIGILDPVAESLRLVNIADPEGPGTDLWGKKYLAATLGKDGLIYVIPEVWDGKILIFDPDTEITTVQGVSITSGGPLDPDTEGALELASVVCAPDGGLWCIPGGDNPSSHVLVIEPSDNTAVAYLPPFIYGWGRSFLASDGMMYASPKASPRLLRINPSDGVINTDDLNLSGVSPMAFGDITEDRFGRIWIPEYAGSSTVSNKLAVYDPHDRPYNRGDIGRVYVIDLPAPWYYDPTNPPDPGSAGYMISGFERSILAKNGMIYCVNSGSLQFENDGSNPWGFYVLEIDPASLVKDPDTLTATVNTRYLFVQEGSSQKAGAIGGLLNLPDGRVIGIPAKDSFDKFLVLDPWLPVIEGDHLLSAHINKI